MPLSFPSHKINKAGLKRCLDVFPWLLLLLPGLYTSTTWYPSDIRPSSLSQIIPASSLKLRHISPHRTLLHYLLWLRNIFYRGIHTLLLWLKKIAYQTLCVSLSIPDIHLDNPIKTIMPKPWRVKTERNGTKVMRARDWKGDNIMLWYLIGNSIWREIYIISNESWTKNMLSLSTIILNPLAFYPSVLTSPWYYAN